MIIIGLIMTNFESNSILKAAGGVLKIGSSPYHHWEI